MIDNEQLATLSRLQAEKVRNVLQNKFLKREFYFILWDSVDTDYSYHLFIRGRANKQIRDYCSGVTDALESVYH